MKTINEVVSQWMSNANVDEETKDFIKNSSSKNIEDSFYKNLEFGTAGIRGKLGPGPNRMNLYTVSRVTRAIAKEIKANKQEDKGVVIGRDSRAYSKEFSELSANIFASEGIKVFLFDTVIPTPILAYSILHLNTAFGIMITASHNTKEYNGYKVYSSDGIQISKEVAKKISKNSSEIEDFLDYKFPVNQCITTLNKDHEVVKSYYKKAKETIEEFSFENDEKHSISVVYTGLHGVGGEYIPEFLKENGYCNLHFVKEQMKPSTDFYTTPSPNPEDEEVFEYGKKLALTFNSDVILATDPDVDRLGVMIKHNGKYEYLDGNVIGTLLSTYILLKLRTNSDFEGKSPLIIKTIVSNNLVEKEGKVYNADFKDVHVGFKNIYSQAMNEENFVFGYEESLGFGFGKKVSREKDAIIASVMVLNMISYYNSIGYSLLDVYKEIQEAHGFTEEKMESILLEGLDGMNVMKEIILDLKNAPISSINGFEISKSIDYNSDETGLEKENVLKFMYEDGSWFAVRPSGTEPKLKIYFYSYGSTKEEAEKSLEILSEKVKNHIKCMAKN